MKKISKLFQLIELTRSQPQYGYALSGIQQDELSNLAEHHYLVTFMAWQLARLVIRAGVEIDMAKVLEYSLIHDLGELFGGDICMPYAKANPEARKHAKAFEEENQKYLAKFFGEDEEYFKSLAKEIMDADTNESLISKLADYIECTHYKIYVGKYFDSDKELMRFKLGEKVAKFKDEKVRQVMSQFVNEWLEGLENKAEVSFE